MSHVSFYRKWRPASFETVVGQERVTRTLRNALAANRIVHAYLFCGHRGTGKTTTARILAKALNCVRGPTPDPCGHCPACQAIAGGYSVDVIEIDAASNRGIDEIRELREKVRLTPTEGRHKVYIIDEAHMLTTEAFNALLKTLEEPPPHAVFVLVTTEPHRLPPTITSRCQRFDFRRVGLREITARLRRIAAEEVFQVDEDALYLIARNADGSLRDAESVLDQLATFTQGRITRADVLSVLGLVEEELALGVADAAIAGDAAEVLAASARIVDEGKDIRQVLRTLLEHFRDLLVVKACEDPGAASSAEQRAAVDAAELVEAGEARLEALREQASRLPTEAILRALRLLGAAEAEARWHPQPRLVLEMALLRLARPDVDPTLEGLQARVEALERALGQGAPPREPPPARSPGAPDVPPRPPARTARPAPSDPSSRRSTGSDVAPPLPRRAAGSPEVPAPVGEATDSPGVAAPPRRRSAGDAGTAVPPSSPRGAGSAVRAPEAAATGAPTVPKPAGDTGHATVAPAGGDAPGVSLEEVLRQWGRILDGVKRRKLFCHALMIESTPVEVAGGTLVLGLRPGFHFHAENLHRPEHAAIVEEAVEQALGTRLRLRCVVLTDEQAGRQFRHDRPAAGGGGSRPPGVVGGASEAVAAPPPASGAEADGAVDPLVARAVQLFGGQVVERRQGRGHQAHPDERGAEGGKEEA
ncbi:MAG: DNA polymerase III subunit gamma/tau [Armatimonadetes bacterium]|nr:DNA polymerase III subunit gamma/tau [Armatimonadota bacterium]